MEVRMRSSRPAWTCVHSNNSPVHAFYVRQASQAEEAQTWPPRQPAMHSIPTQVSRASASPAYGYPRITHRITRLDQDTLNPDPHNSPGPLNARCPPSPTPSNALIRVSYTLHSQIRSYALASRIFTCIAGILNTASWVRIGRCVNYINAY